MRMLHPAKAAAQSRRDPARLTWRRPMTWLTKSCLTKSCLTKFLVTKFLVTKSGLIGSLATVVVSLCLIAPALADDDAAPDSDHGRYTFGKIADGFLKLDTRTGEVSVCSRRAVGWACVAAPEDRALLENEIARLRAENGALKKELLARGVPLPSGATPQPPPAQDEDRPPQLGGHPDFDRMIALADRMWHRLVDAIARAQKQMLNKS
jgi:hypothetical protein